MSSHAAPLSNYLGMRVLSDNPTPLSSALGLRVLIDDPTPLSRKFNIPVLLTNDRDGLDRRDDIEQRDEPARQGDAASRYAAPLSTRFGWRVLIDNPAPLSRWLNIPVLLSDRHDDRRRDEESPPVSPE